MTTARSQIIDSSFETQDSTVILFNDSNYKLTLHLFGEGGYDNNLKNATLTFIKTIGSTSAIEFKDSLNCMKPWIDFRDYNADGIKDVLVFNTSSARSNWTHYLYLVDNKKKKLQSVNGFTNLLNPEANNKTGVITSAALYGENVFYSSYKITAKGKLIRIGLIHEEKTH